MSDTKSFDAKTQRESVLEFIKSPNSIKRYSGLTIEGVEPTPMVKDSENDSLYDYNHESYQVVDVVPNGTLHPVSWERDGKKQQMLIGVIEGQETNGFPVITEQDYNAYVGSIGQKIEMCYVSRETGGRVRNMLIFNQLQQKAFNSFATAGEQIADTPKETPLA